MNFESWKIYHIARKHLPKDLLQTLYTRSSRLIYLWAANPKYCEQTQRNPIDRIRIMLEAIDDAGYGEYARAAIDYMAEPLGGQYTDKTNSKSDKGTIDGEIADMSIATGDLAKKTRDSLEDGKIDASEWIKLKEAARYARLQIEELLDAAGMNKNEKA